MLIAACAGVSTADPQEAMASGVEGVKAKGSGAMRSPAIPAAHPAKSLKKNGRKLSLYVRGSQKDDDDPFLASQHEPSKTSSKESLYGGLGVMLAIILLICSGLTYYYMRRHQAQEYLTEEERTGAFKAPSVRTGSVKSTIPDSSERRHRKEEEEDSSDDDSDSDEMSRKVSANYISRSALSADIGA